MKSLSRDRVQKFFDLAKIIFKSQCKSLQFASKRRRISLKETCRKADFAHFVRRAEKGEYGAKFAQYKLYKKRNVCQEFEFIFFCT